MNKYNFQTIALKQYPQDGDKFLIASDNNCTLYAVFHANKLPFKVTRYELHWIMKSPTTGSHAIFQPIENPFPFPLIITPNDRVKAHWIGFLFNQTKEKINWKTTYDCRTNHQNL